MTCPDVYIVDTGAANVGSLVSTLRACGAANVTVTKSAKDVQNASHVVVPGVSSFGTAAHCLSQSSLVEPLVERVKEGKPTLLVCVGLQLLASCSEESPGVAGLGIIKAFIQQLPDTVRVPQQSWNAVEPAANCKILQPGHAYFSNSYCLQSIPLGWAAATAVHGTTFVAGLEKGAVIATQFHPELSGTYGTALLKRFLSLSLPSTPFPALAAAPLNHRVIPCLDVRAGRVVKGVQFQGLADAGDPVELALEYERQGADEIVVLDVTATQEKRKAAVELIQKIKERLTIPLTVGAGIKSIEDAAALLTAGCDKVSINSAAVRDPSIISTLSQQYGSQCIVLAVDAVSRKDSDEHQWDVVISSGNVNTGKDAVAWAKEGVRLGAGEILLTSFDKDGTKTGYDLNLVKAVAANVNVPVIASGGASTSTHMKDALAAGADAVLAASIFHYGETTVTRIKQELLLAGIPVRPFNMRKRIERRNVRCIIPSIDIMGGHAVQLVGGDPANKRVDAGDPVPIAERFRVAGEIAVVDLDAALGQGDNTDVVKHLCTLTNVRIGGGIRTLERALQWLNLGASKIVIGTAATPEFLQNLPRERVVVALDARHGEVVVEGWKTNTGKTVEESIKALLPYAGGFLVTFVETEGRMEGINLDAVEKLADLIAQSNYPSTQLTVAGGISTIEEIAALDSLGVEAQIGMALYTGKLDFGKAIAAPLHSDRPDGLIPTVVSDVYGRSLGLCYSSKETIALAVTEQRGIYQSRSRGTVWKKGEKSGNTQRLVQVNMDCDRDTVNFVVEQAGKGFCHNDTFTCFGDGNNGIPGLLATLFQRKKSAPSGSYTKKLFENSELLHSKIIEEAHELCEANSFQDVAHEAADVLYFTFVKCAQAGVNLSDIERVLDLRRLRVTRRPGDAKPQYSKDTEVAAHPVDDVVLKAVPAAHISMLRRPPVDAQAKKVAEEILNDLRERGEKALLHHAQRLGDIDDDVDYIISKEEMCKCYHGLGISQRHLLDRTAKRIREFAMAQRASLQTLIFNIPGGQAGHTISPVERAGCYAPGGRYPLPSSVLMTAITARVAGCNEVWVASPRPPPMILAAAYAAGADGFLAVGGAQAIGALAYGIGRVPACDAIVGPGNAFVTAAKSLIAGSVVIDMLAGPSELLVLADETADASIVASDLLAQAEHDVHAIPILVTVGNEGLLEAVNHQLKKQLTTLPSAQAARKALSNGFCLQAASMDEAVTLCNEIAPEHLEIHTSGAEHVAHKLRHYGAAFVGSNAAEVIGDYGAGPNHTLPTGGTARAYGGLSVFTFQRIRTWLRIDNLLQAQPLVKDCVELAMVEGLHGHARSAQRRLIDHRSVDTSNSTVSKVSPTNSSSNLSEPLPNIIQFGVPKGRMFDNVMNLLEESGIQIKVTGRILRPTINLPGWEVKLLKPRNVVEMLHHGTRDIGFVGTDLVAELNATNVIPYFDTGLDPVRIVAAVPEHILINGTLPKKRLRIATEYVALTEKWVRENNIDAEIIRTYGSTEVFPPEDADMIVDNTATGATLKANKLVMMDVLLSSSTHVAIHKAVLEHPRKRAELDKLILLLKSAMNARGRVLMEFNVPSDKLAEATASIPCMRQPTVSPLYDKSGFAVRSAVPRSSVTELIPIIKAHGGTDILVSDIQQIIV